MHEHRMRIVLSAVLLSLLAAGFAILMSCGGAMTSPPSGPAMSGQVTTILTDPPTCSAPNGPFKNVWVTVTKVTANLSSTAADTDSGWQTLVDLTANPRQIDLFSLASPTCVLTQLGSTTGLPPGSYQQIRFYLLSNSPASGVATPSPNNCGAGAFNCVVTSLGTFPLLLSSEAQTGLKIPPGQIAGGAITLQANQAADLTIDFNACASILQQGNGGYRLKPTLNAGVVSVNNSAISGTVVVQGTTTPISGAMVLLEQPDTSVTPSIDRVKVAGVTDSGGHFIFCPLPGAGPYDVVVAAVTPGTTPTYYNPTIAFSVPMGTDLGNIPLAPEGATPATITGQVATATGASTAIVGDVTLSAMQDATPTGGTQLQVTIPVFGGVTSQPPTVTTTATPTPSTPTCPTNTDCYNFTLLVPGSNALVATYNSSNTPPITFPTTPPGAPINYYLNALDTKCTPTPNATTGPVAVTAGATTNVSTALGLSGCTG